MVRHALSLAQEKAVYSLEIRLHCVHLLLIFYAVEEV